MIDSATSRLRVATILQKLVPQAQLDDTEKGDLQTVIATKGLVGPDVRYRFQAYDLEDFFGHDIPVDTAATLRQALIDASGNSGNPEPPRLLPTTWVVELVEYFVLFGD